MGRAGEEPRPARDHLGCSRGPPLPSRRVTGLQTPPNRPIAGAIDQPWRPDNQPAEPRRPAPRLYLVTPPVADPARLADALAAALDAADVAAVLLPLAGDDERALLNGVKALAPAVQGKGAALVAGRPSRPGGARRRRRRASRRHRRIQRRAGDAQAGADRRLRRARHAPRRHARRRGRRRLRDVRRAGRRRPPAVVRRRARARRVVGGGVRDPLRRLRREHSTRSRRWRRPAPISSRSARSSSTIRAGRPRRCRMPRRACRCRRPRDDAHRGDRDRSAAGSAPSSVALGAATDRRAATRRRSAPGTSCRAAQRISSRRRLPERRPASTQAEASRTASPSRSRRRAEAGDASPSRQPTAHRPLRSRQPSRPPALTRRRLAAPAADAADRAPRRSSRRALTGREDAPMPRSSAATT